MVVAVANKGERGFMMVALLIGIAIAAVVLGAALPAWSTLARREREAELIWRGEQYARAIQLFQRKYAGTFPPNFDVLVNEHLLRKKYKDPITGEDFQPIAVGQAIAGPQATNPFAPDQGRGATGRAGAAGQSTARAGGTGPATAGRGATQTVRSTTFQLGGTQGGTSTGGFGQVGPTAGIMGVTSKSKDASLRLYKGADHYNQWQFIGVMAANQAGGRGAQTPGQGVRGGQPPGPVGRGGTGGISGPGGGARPGQSPFGGASPFGGRGPAPAPAPPPGSGR